MVLAHAIARRASMLIVCVACLGCSPGAPSQPPLVDSMGLQPLSERIGSGAFGDIAAVIVSRNGQIVFEDYYGSHGPDQHLDMRSVGKSITALAVGLAIEDGSLSGIEERVWPAFADLGTVATESPAKQRITVGDLLSMRSALDCTDWRDSPGNEERMYRTREWTRFALSIPVRAGGQTSFSYCTAGVFLLGQMVERASGLRFDSYVGDRLLAPLGIAKVDWRRSPTGEVQGGGQLGLRARDAELLGRLVLQNGWWEGQQIIPEAWIAQMLRPRSEAAPGLGYGYLWWSTDLRPGGGDSPVSAHLMLGNGGNMVLLMPRLDAVVVVQATNYRDPAAYDLARALVETGILPALLKR